MTHRSSVVVAAALALALTGCGGASDQQEAPRSSEQARSAASSPSRAELVADATRIGAGIKEGTERLAMASPPTRRQMLAIIDAWSVTVAELRALKPPPAEARRFGRMLAHFEAAIRAARALPRASGETALVAVAAIG